MVTRYVLDGWNNRKPTPIGNEHFDVYTELDGTNQLIARYLHGDEFDQTFARVLVDCSTPEVHWLLTDHLNSVRLVLDESGAVLDQLAYDAFGNIVAQLNPLLTNPILFASREFDFETGLYYNRARYLDPSTGRWTTQDPMGFVAGDANLYRYVGNMATMATDPNGLDRLIIVGNQVNFERTYYITPWSNGGTYSIGSLIEIDGVQYVRHGRYLVPLEQVRDAIERTFTIGYGGEWRADSNKITEWFHANDVSSEVAKPHDQRKVADRMFGPTVIVGTMAAITVRTMVTHVTEAVLVELATSFGPAKFAEFVAWAGKRGIKAVRNSNNELLHLADHNGKQLTKQEIQAAAAEFDKLALTRQSLIGELAQKGVKHTPENIIAIGKDASGKIVFLEKGNPKAGLQHIIKEHGSQFAQKGVPESQISDLVFKAATEGKQVGMQGTRPVFEVEFGGKIHRVAVQVSDNGFIVGANPK